MILYVANILGKPWPSHAHENTRFRTCLDQFSTTYNEQQEKGSLVCAYGTGIGAMYVELHSDTTLHI